MTRSSLNPNDSHELNARDWLRAGLAVTVVLTIGLGGLSCGGGSKTDGGDGGSSSAAVESLLEEAEAAMQAAEAAGADKLFAADFKKNVARIEEGRKYIENDNASQAKSKFRFAKKEFGKLASKVGEVAELKKEALASKPEIDKIRAEAVKLEAPKLAKREFEQADKLYKRVLQDVESGSSVKIRRSKSTLNTVQEEFERSIEVAKDNRQRRDAAVQEKALLKEWQEKAKAAGAEKFAAQDLLYAQQLEREGDTYLNQGDFRTAGNQFKASAQSYAAAIQLATGEKELAAATAKAARGQPAPAPGDQPIPTPDSPRPPTGSGDVDDIPPLGGGPDALIQEHISRLATSFKGGGGSYDPGTGEVVLNYADAKTLQRDIHDGFSNPKVGRNNKYLLFRDVTQVKSGGSSLGPGGIPGGAPAEPVDLSFAANTKGLFLIDVPLKPPITMDYDVNLQFIEQKGQFGPLLFATGDASAFWWVDYITFRFQAFKKPLQTFPWAEGVPKDRRRPASRWFDKVNIIHMKVAVELDENDESKCRIKVFYDDDFEPSNVSIQLKSDLSGLVGFRWYKSRVNISNLQIRGILDREKALTALAKKGVNVATAKESPTTPGGDDGEETPTTPKETTPTTPKKKGSGDDDFDF